MDEHGVLMCAKYSIPPNFFGYCGPPKNSNLVDHLREQKADKEISLILSEFETLYLYLKLISIENKIADCFNKKVVEAYWLGNSLLKNTSNIDYANLLKEKFEIEKKIGRGKTEKINAKILSYRFYPHHSFHVFNIFKRTGHDPSFHTLKTMDECRIGWGKISQKSCLRRQAKVKSQKFILVETKPLIIKGDKLDFGETILKEIKFDYKGKSFICNLKVGDWISFHWGFICDVLTENQVKNLEFYTQKSIDFFNAK